MRYEIEQDQDPCNPRTMFDNLGTLLCAQHRNYTLGDKQTDESPSEVKERLALKADPALKEWVDRADRILDLAYYHNRTRHHTLETAVSKKFDAWVDRAFDENYVWEPVYLYDHSGITMRTTPFSCPWDSGQIGIIYMDKDTVIREWGDFHDTTKEKAEAVLKAEVEEYDCYISGEVYGYRLLDESDQEIDSCWGYYGRQWAEEAAREVFMSNQAAQEIIQDAIRKEAA